MAENLNIMFKRGQQANLNSNYLNAQKSEVGCFYLTTDTNRLYVGQDANKAPVLLNQTVQIVAKVADLPKTAIINDFYYCQEENILAVYRSDGQWKQINPDTNTNDDTKVTEAGFSAGSVSGTSVSYNLTLKQVTTDVNGGKTNVVPDISATLTLSAADLEAILHDPASVGLAAASTTSGAKISTKGTGSDTSAAVELKSGDNVTISVSGNAVTVAATDTTYELKTVNDNSKAKIRLTGGDGSNNDVEFAAGTDMTVAVDTASGSNKITYNHAAYGAVTPTSAGNETLDADGSFTAVTGITTTNGHVTGISTKQFTLPSDTTISSITNSNNKDWKVTINESNGGAHSIDFSSDAEALAEELRGEIESQLAAANTALTYKGTVSSYEGLTGKSNVEIGDVYLMDGDGSATIGGKLIEYKPGDLFIATVKSNGTHTGGVIANGSVEWTYVPSGDELNTDTHFYGDVNFADNQVSYVVQAIKGSDGTQVEVDGNETLSIKAGRDLELSNSNGVALIDHKEYAAVSKPNATNVSSSTEFTAITDVTVENGHITAVKSEKFTARTYEVEGANNCITLKDSDGNTDNYISVSGDGSWISAQVAGNALTVSHNTIGAKNVSANNTNTVLTEKGTFNIISGVQSDAAGHVTQVSTQTLTLPDNTTYAMYLADNQAADGAYSSSTPSANDDAYVFLKDKDGSKNSVAFHGDGSVRVYASKEAVNVSLVWGSF